MSIRVCVFQLSKCTFKFINMLFGLYKLHTLCEVKHLANFSPIK